MTKTKTGIAGFDKLVQGGFERGATVLLCGTPGTAKTIFSLEFAYNGASKYKEKSLYVTFEETRPHLMGQAKQFKWDLEKYEKKGLFHILSISTEEINHETVNSIIEYVIREKIERLVIDSLSTLSINAPIYFAINDVFLKEFITEKAIYSPAISEDFLLKRFVYNLINQLHKLNVTSILISEIGKDSKFYSRDTVSEFMADGIIEIVYESLGGDFSRSLLVRKMRHIKNDEDIHPLEISKTGLIVHDVN